jgi:DNA-binding NarL/FixJ family response regulator
MESRLPFIKALIAEIGLEALLEIEVRLIRTRPVPMKLADKLLSVSEEEIERQALTSCQIKVLTLAARGFTREETARYLRRSPETVKTHMHLAKRRLGARTHTHTVVLAIQEGYIAA